MNLLILKGFNNYFNRIVVKYDTLQDYKTRSKSFLDFPTVNFNVNDGVSTEIIVGNENQQASSIPLNWENDGSPDYLVCYETHEEPVEDGASGETEIVVEIKHRWFIIECQRTRNGQYRLVLKRDSIADHQGAIEEATCFMEKGIIENIDDSAIFNKEEITTNQIKTGEFLLKDETQCGWIVGYVAKDRESSGTLTPTTFTEQTIAGPDASDSACDEIFADETAFYQAHPELLGDLATLSSWCATVKVDIFYGKLLTYYKVGQTINCYNNGTVTYEESAYENDLYLHSIEDGDHTMMWKLWLGDYRDTLANNFVAGWKSDSFKSGILDQIAAKENIIFTSESNLQSFFNYIKRNPTIKIGTKYYKPYDKYGVDGATSAVTASSFVTLGSTAYDLMYNNLDLTPEGISGEGHEDHIEGTPGPETFKVEYAYTRHALGLREIFSECKVKIPASVPVLVDAPYHMFAIPYSNDLALYNGNSLHCVTNQSVAMNAAQALATNAGAGVVYDIQLLPYCPIRDIIKTNQYHNYPSMEPGTYDYVTVRPQIGLEKYIEEPIVKLNHQYIISKEISLSSSVRVLGIRSQSPITIKVGTSNIQNPTSTFTIKRLEVRYSDIDDTGSAINIYLYNDYNGTDLHESISYSSYTSGNTIIGVEFTDVCEYAGTVSSLLPPQHNTIQYSELKYGYRPRISINEIDSMFKDYIVYKNYYLSKVDISNAITSDIVTVVGGVEADIVNTVFWCTKSQFSFNRFIDNYFLIQSDGSYKKDTVNKPIEDFVKFASSIKDIKVKNQVEMMRLASPNYSNFFDINVQRNKGVEYINIDCTYKPYQPYMHLNPNFKGLYGNDYNDVRGLICGGDFSIALTTDAWATYQLQNKNYQAVFDRQIQQLEVAQSIQAQNDIVNAIAGVGTGAIGGAVTGGLVGGGYGAIAGAVIGGVSSAVGGMADVMNNQRLRELQISTMKDIHGYQLDNIKALPQGLAKTSYLTNNNKLFPFLEFYTCTPIEAQAVRDKLDYNGMTINRVGKVKEFQSEEQLPYIRAKLIRIDMIDDAHQVKAISDELATGVYLPKIVEEEDEGE